MPIVLYTLRPRIGHDKLMEYTEPHWTAPAIEDIFQNTDRYLGKIPEAERWNLYYTVADVHTDRKAGLSRQLRSQSHIPIDIDDCPPEFANKVINIVGAVFGIEPTHMISMYSGHGVQCLIQLMKPFTNKEYFEKYRPYYKLALLKIHELMKEHQIPGKPDPTMWSNARLARMPKTINRKKDLPDVMSYTINATSQIYDIDLELKFPTEAAGYLPKNYTSKFPTPDHNQIINDCGFLRHCRDDAATLSEPDWYDMASIVARFENGSKLFHEWSRSHPGYTPENAQSKLEQALTKTGPATCDRIGERFEGCKTCVHYKKITSPITIRGEEFIVTEKSGFHFIVAENKPPKPDYEGLRRYFSKLNPYVMVAENDKVYLFNGKYWDGSTSSLIRGFAYQHFNPKPVIKMYKEFDHTIKSEPRNHRPHSWFNESTIRRMCFQNSVLNIDTMEAVPHSTDFGFLGAQAYDYDPAATAPVFTKFLKDITCDDEKLTQIILEFIGYTLSGDDQWLQKALVLKGDGANGKSTLLNVITALIGESLISNVGPEQFQDQYYIAMMFGKLANISSESPRDALLRPDLFKALTGDDKITGRAIRENPITQKARAKMIFAVNEMPATGDVGYSLMRRLLIIPFDRTFKEGEQDPTIGKKMLQELPGILNLCLQAYKQLCKQREFTTSDRSEAELKTFISNVDHVKEFSENYIQVHDDPAKYATQASVYPVYSEMVKRDGGKPLSRQRFFDQLRKHIPGYKQRVSQRKIEGRPVKVITGIKVLANEFDSPLENEKEFKLIKLET